MTWQQLRDLKLAELTDAADGWGAASKFADHARERVDGDMSGKLSKTQNSESYDSAVKRLKRLSENYHYIHTEAGLIRGTLDAFATELGAPQNRLIGALDEAFTLGFTVNEFGGVTYPAGGTNGASGGPVPGGAVMGGDGTSKSGTGHSGLDGNGRYDPVYGPAGAGMTSPNPNRAKAQDIADRIAHAVREAREIDDRYSPTILKFKAAPGLAVDRKTWADVASDADNLSVTADDYIKKHIPLDGSPTDRKKWWDELSQSQRDEYMSAFPEVIGNLDGIPATVRDEANRENLQMLIGQLSQSNAGDAKEKMDAMVKIQSQLEAPHQKHQMYLLGIGDEGNGRAIVAYGNPDTAKNVAAYVPGLETRLDTKFVDGTMSRALDTAIGAAEMDRHTPTSSIVWLGYDAPQLSVDDLTSHRSVLFREDAMAGAPKYNEFMAGISAANEHHSDAHVTAIGHSYGSLTVGEAAQAKGGIPGADDIVLVGSPGTGADDASELNVGKGHVYVGAAENDAVTKLPPGSVAAGTAAGATAHGASGFVRGGGMGLGGLINGFAGTIEGGISGHHQAAADAPDRNWFGTDPANHSFGATRFQVADGLPLTEGGFDAHSNYFNRTKDLTSADNIANVVVGHPGALTLEQPR
nr:alpha/beta hydrolase [Streptomyces sp. SID14478]